MEQHIGEKAYTEDSYCVGVARVGQPSQKIIAGKMKEFLDIDMGEPLHSFVICAKELHPIEQDMYKFFGGKINPEDEKKH